MGALVGLDVGDRRIGVAVSDVGRRIATPHSVIVRIGWGPDIRRIRAVMEEKQADYAVMGLPLNMDGSEGFQAEKIRVFAHQAEAAGIRIVFQDERLSTVTAEDALIEGGMRREERKQTVDKVAAAVILQAYLDSGAAEEGEKNDK